MVHTQVITPQDLNSFSGTRDGQEVLPELLRMLIRASVSQLAACRIPYGDSIGQTGLDGFVVTEDGFGEFVPKGESYWECGTGQEVQDKATEDLGKRTKDVPDEATRAKTTFVFATLRNTWEEASQRSWKERHKEKKWKQLKVIDGIILADWLRSFPAVARWLMRKIDPKRTSSNWRTPTEHWENLLQLPQVSDPPLPVSMFLLGRNRAIEEVAKVFEGTSEHLCLGVENSLDAEDFVAALIEGQDPQTKSLWAGKCLFIQGADEWSSMLQLSARHVLVASGALDLEDTGQQLRLAAKKARHAVIFPSSQGPTDASGVVKLNSPSAAQIADALTKAGYSAPRIKVLVEPSSSLLASVKRRLENLSDAPSYANGPGARSLAQFGLLGRLHGGNAKDIEAFERVLGKSFGEWLEIVRPEVLKPGTPLTQQNQHWKVVARGEAWSALGRWLDDDDLNRLQEVAVAILGEDDPTIDIPKEDRWAASIKGKHLEGSGAMRKGLAETLALLGSRSGALVQCSTGHAEMVAISVVRKLLKDADWKRWMSLHDLLPMLAEAAPEQFLEAVEGALEDPNSTPFLQLFAQEGDGAMGWNYVSGLLWSLETLAWHPDYLGQVVQILAAMASIDPGGKWANRPANSLTQILLPWLPQTTAPIRKRIAAVRAASRDYPAVAWSLVSSLLPRWGGSSSWSCKPTWRTDLMAGWEERPARQDYFAQVEGYASLAIELATDDMNRLGEVVEKLPELPPETRDAILTAIVSQGVKDSDEGKRLPVWEALVDLAARHRAFADAQWAMPTAEIEKIEMTATVIAPVSARLRHRRLFSDRDADLFEPHEDFHEQERRLAKRRQEAIREVLQEVGEDGVVAFAGEVVASDKVGLAVGGIEQPGNDARFLPSLLCRVEPHVRAFVAGFVHARWEVGAWKWVERLPLLDWPHGERATFFTLFRFSPEVWRRAEESLGDQASLYWKAVSPWPWGMKEGMAEAIERLLQHGRARVALAFCGVAARTKQAIPPVLALRALRESGQGEDATDRLDPQAAIATIKWLQEQPGLDESQMSVIEWSYLPLLVDHLGAAPLVLEAQLAREPSKFCEVVRRAYRSEGEGENANVISEEDKLWARAAYRLLNGMRAVPGMSSHGTVDRGVLAAWLAEVRRLATESGHLGSALRQVGQVFGRAAIGENWLSLNPAVAEALDAKDAEPMRKEFTSQLYNNRGVFSPDGGKGERELAARFHLQAAQMDELSLFRIGTALRDLAKEYEREAIREAAERDNAEGSS